MAHFKAKEGLDIPINGAPEGDVQTLVKPKEISLNVHPFPELRFKLLAKVGDKVALGQPLLLDKACEGRYFASPAGGVIKEVRRGLKRRLLDVVIAVDEKEEVHQYKKINLDKASSDELLEYLKGAGFFAKIRQRPFNILAQPNKRPRCIFVKAVESAPFAPSAEMQVEGHEEDLQLGLEALGKISSGSVHFVHHKSSQVPAFTQAKAVEKHTVEGPHPVGNASVHIHHFDPVKNVEDVIWTVKLNDVIGIGHLLRTGQYFVEQIVSIGGEGVTENKRGYFAARQGFPIAGLISGRNTSGNLRMISGDVLCGQKVEMDDFIHFSDHTFTVIPENTEREFMHFFRPGFDKFTASRTYMSGHLSPGSKKYSFTTSLHGEKRFFIDGTIYQKVMPMQIPVVQLLRAIMGGDYDLAEELGVLEVASEDFALPTFVCPSKMEMTDLMEQSLYEYAVETVH
jgi:Na+-transporting NADH:ubiquinone oxidoreductase subunit A